MKRKPLHVGARFGRWVVTGFAEMRTGYRSYYHCRCDCGVVGLVWQQDLRARKSRSCGCLQREITGKNARKHGMSRSPEYATWSDIKKRCYNSAAKSFPTYGERGIIVCRRWRVSFAAFFKDMGEKPGPAYSIDRIDNNGNYEPGNCRWATRKEQNCNRKNNHWIEHNGRRATITDWARSLGIGAPALRGRLDRGWPLARALWPSQGGGL